MWPTPAGYGAVVRASNGLRVSVDVYRAGERLFSGLPPVGGGIVVDTSSATRRIVNLTLPPFLRTGTYTEEPTLPDPELAEPVLGTRGHELRITHTLVASDGSFLPIPVGRFRCDEIDGSDLGRTEVTLTGVSRESYVADDRFTSPRTVKGPSAASLIEQLIRETLPQAVIINTVSQDAIVRPTTEDEDRWGLILTLAKSIGAQVYADPLGQFRIADLPTTATDAVWTFEPGVDGRSLLDSRRTDSRASVKNRVAVQGSTPDGATDPIMAIATDDDPTSPTVWGDPDAGAWGKATDVLSQPNLTSLAQCLRVANAELTRSTGARSGMDLSAVPHAALEGNDMVDVVVPTSVSGRTKAVRRHVVDAFTLPLTPGGEFPVATRDLREVTPA